MFRYRLYTPDMDELGEAPAIVRPKSQRSYRAVPLLPRLQEALEALYAGEDDAEFVLRTRRGTPLSQRNAGRSIDTGCPQAILRCPEQKQKARICGPFV